MDGKEKPKKVYSLTLSFSDPSEMERFLRSMGLKAIWSGGSIASGDTLAMPPTTEEGQISLYDSFKSHDSEE